MTIQARDITRALRTLLPHVQPLTTKRNLSGNGLVLGYTVTMPEPAARNLGVTRFDGAGRFASGYLSRHLGTTVRATDVYATNRTSGGKLVHLDLAEGKENHGEA